MDVWAITVAAARRWYVLLPLLALTALGAYQVGQGVSPEYEASATAILVPGSQVEEETTTPNPYGNLDQTNRVISIVLDAPESRAVIEAQGHSPDYEVRATDRSSILNLSVLTDSEPESLATLEAVLDLGTQELATRMDEAGVPEASQPVWQILQAPAISDVSSSGALRNMAIVGIIGAALSLLIAVLFDDLVKLVKGGLARRRDRSAEHGDG